MTITQAPALSIRPYRADDLDRVLALLSSAMGPGPAGQRQAAFFTWKHLQNPAGRSFMLVAEADGQLVGLRAFMRWRFTAGSQVVRAVRPVDTATHPDHQGRGIFSALTAAALERLEEEADLVFNTPNAKSLPGYLKLGWQIVGRVPIRIRVLRPLRFAGGLRASMGATGGPLEDVSGLTAAEVLADGSSVTALLNALRPPIGISTPRTQEYLWWRYATAPQLGYRAAVVNDDHGLRGLAIYRVRRRGSLAEATVAECCVRPGDVGGARRLLRVVARSAQADHIAVSWPHASEAHRAGRLIGYLRAPGGMTLVARPLRELLVDPLRLESWGLTLGDLEVF